MSSSSAWCRAWTATNWPTRSGCPATTRTRWSPGPAASRRAPAGGADARVPRARAQDVRRPLLGGACAPRERGGPRRPVRPVRLPQAEPPARGVRLAPDPAAFPRPGGQRGHRGGGGRGQRGAGARRRGTAVSRARGRSPRQRGPGGGGQLPRRSLRAPGQFARRPGERAGAVGPSGRLDRAGGAGHGPGLAYGAGNVGLRDVRAGFVVVRARLLGTGLVVLLLGPGLV